MDTPYEILRTAVGGAFSAPYEGFAFNASAGDGDCHVPHGGLRPTAVPACRLCREITAEISVARRRTLEVAFWMSTEYPSTETGTTKGRR